MPINPTLQSQPNNSLAPFPTTPPYFKAWIVYFFVSLVLQYLAVAFVGALCGIGLSGFDLSVDQLMLVMSVLGFLAVMPVSFLVYRWATDRFIVQPITRGR